jgi:hypothetical protein
VYPERFLSSSPLEYLTEEEAHPEEVKHLTIILDFNTSGSGYTYDDTIRVSFLIHSNFNLKNKSL